MTNKWNKIIVLINNFNYLYTFNAIFKVMSTLFLIFIFKMLMFIFKSVYEKSILDCVHQCRKLQHRIMMMNQWFFLESCVLLMLEQLRHSALCNWCILFALIWLSFCAAWSGPVQERVPFCHKAKDPAAEYNCWNWGHGHRYGQSVPVCLISIL